MHIVGQVVKYREVTKVIRDMDLEGRSLIKDGDRKRGKRRNYIERSGTEGQRRAGTEWVRQKLRITDKTGNIKRDRYSKEEE